MRYVSDKLPKTNADNSFYSIFGEYSCQFTGVALVPSTHIKLFKIATSEDAISDKQQ